MPESLHLFGQSERNADISVERREMASDHDVVLAKVLDKFVHGMHRVYHDEVRMRVDRLDRARHRLIEEFLPVVAIALNGLVGAVSVLKSSARSKRRDGIDVVL